MSRAGDKLQNICIDAKTGFMFATSLLNLHRHGQKLVCFRKTIDKRFSNFKLKFLLSFANDYYANMVNEARR